MKKLLRYFLVICFVLILIRIMGNKNSNNNQRHGHSNEDKRCENNVKINQEEKIYYGLLKKRWDVFYESIKTPPHTLNQNTEAVTTLNKVINEIDHSIQKLDSILQSHVILNTQNERNQIVETNSRNWISKIIFNDKSDNGFHDELIKLDKNINSIESLFFKAFGIPLTGNNKINENVQNTESTIQIKSIPQNNQIKDNINKLETKENPIQSELITGNVEFKDQNMESDIQIKSIPQNNEIKDNINKLETKENPIQSELITGNVEFKDQNKESDDNNINNTNELGGKL